MPYFGVFDNDFYYCLIKHLLWLLSCLCMFKNIAVRNGGVGGQMGKGKYAMGGRSKRTSACSGGGGSNFCHFGAYVLIE